MSDEDVVVGITADDSGLAHAFEHASATVEGKAHEIEGHLESIKEGMEGVTEIFEKFAELAGIGLSIEWLIDIAKESYEAAENVQNLTHVLGMSADTIQTLGVAAGMVGGNIDTAAMAMQRLDRAAEMASSGSQRQAEAFRLIGIDAQQMAELLKNPQEMLQTVAEHLNQFQDGTQKTAIVMELFGRNAGQMIPFLREIGEGMDQLKEKGQELGVVLSQDDQEQLVRTQEALNEAKLAAQGLGNELGVALAPVFQSFAKGFVEFVTSDAVKSFFRTMGADIAQTLTIWQQLKEAAQSFWNYLTTNFPIIGETFHKVFDGMGGDVISFVKEANDGLADFVGGAQKAWIMIQVAADVVWREIANSFNAVISGVLQSMASVADFEQKLYSKVGLDSIAGKFADISTSLKGMADGFKQVEPDMDGYTKKIADIDQSTADWKKSNEEWATSARDQTNALYGVSAASDDAGEHQKQLGDMLGQTQQKAQAVREEFDKFIASLSAIGLSQFDAEWQKYLNHVDQAHDLYLKAREAGLSFAEATELETKALNANNDALARQSDEMNAHLADAIDKINRKYQEQIDGLKGLGIQQEIEKQYLQDLATFQAVWTKAMGDGVPVTEEMKQKIHDMAAAHVEEIDALKQSQAQLKEWQTIATNAFDQAFQAINKDIIEGGSVMKDLVNVAKTVVEQIILEFEKLAIINPLLNQIFGLSGSSALPTSSVGSIFNNIGNLFGGGGNAGGSMFNLLGGGGGTSSTDPDFMPGGALFGQNAGNSFVNTVAPYLLLAGSAYAGINEYQNAGGGVQGAIGGAAYAAGTYFAGAALATAGAIPVIGWVAIAAMLVDKFTGGDLFGTAYKPTGVTGENVSFGSSGVSATNWYQEHKHGALFSSGHYKNVDVPESADQKNALDQAFAQEETTLEAAAAALGVNVSDSITASWSETTDKTGKVVSQQTTIMGQKFNEDLNAAFQRVTADNELAMLGPEAQQVAQQWQSSASMLAAGTAFLIQAQVDINHGMGLLGDSDKSLADITAIVQQLQVSGETLMQTYVRLQVETADVKADFESMGIQLSQTGADLVKFSDEAAKAAGGVDNLNNELAKLYQDYTPASQQNAQSISNLKKNSDDALTAIGEQTNETMAQFWADFQAALPHLTGEELQKWITAGLALSDYTNAVTQSADSLTQAQTDYANNEIMMYGDPFVSAVAAATEAVQRQIDQTNKLAIAAGHAGASQQDLQEILFAGSAAIGKAIADLTNGIYNDINSLYSVFVPPAGGDADNAFGLSIGRTLPVTGPNSAQVQQAKQQSTGFDLLQKLGDYMFSSGLSYDQTLAKFGLTTQELATALGISPDQVKQDVENQSKQDSATLSLLNVNTESRDILRDMLDVMQGKAPSVDLTAYTGTPPDYSSLSKPGKGNTGAHTGKELSADIKEGNSGVEDKMAEAVKLLADIAQTLKGTGGTIIRSNRTTFANP